MSKTIHRLPLRQLRANPSNPRTITQSKLDKLVQSLRQFPQMLELRPLVVESLDNPVVLGGNMRLRALQQLGVEEVPVLEASELSAEQRGEFVIKDNVGFGEWDWEALANEWDPVELSDWGLDIPDLAAESASVEEDEVPELPSEPLTKPGDVWTLGRHRLLCGDSTKAENVKQLMAGAKAGIMVTDPPYGVDYDGGQANAKKREKLSGDDTTEVFNAGLSAALNAVPSGAWYIWHAGRYAEPVYAAIRKCGFEVRALIIWNKLKAHYGAPSAHYCQKHEPCLYAVRHSAGFCGPSNEVTVWDIEQPHKNELHPTQKPIICMARAIKNHKAELVYDPFLGSGTTLIAAEQLGRTCYGMEISPAYCDVIVARWEKLTGQQAVRSQPINEPNEK